MGWEGKSANMSRGFLREHVSHDARIVGTWEFAAPNQLTGEIQIWRGWREESKNLKFNLLLE